MLKTENDEESEYNINSFGKELDLNEDSTGSQNHSLIEIDLKTIDANKYYDEEKEIKSDLLKLVSNERIILSKTLFGAVLSISVEIDFIDIGYISNRIAPFIGKFKNSKGKRYKVNYF